MDIGVEVHMANLGGLLAKAVEFRDPRLMLQLGSHKGTWSSVWLKLNFGRRWSKFWCNREQTASGTLPPGNCLPTPRVLHSTPLSLAVSRCSQQVPCQNSSSMLISCDPQCLASLSPKSFCSQKSPQRRSKRPDVLCGAITLLTKKCHRQVQTDSGVFNPYPS